LALITAKEALLWTDGRYFLQATQQLSDRWKLMRMGEDPPVEVWIADVSINLLSSENFLQLRNLPHKPIHDDEPYMLSVLNSAKFSVI
jgi:hypothetical protein